MAIRGRRGAQVEGDVEVSPLGPEQVPARALLVLLRDRTAWRSLRQYEAGQASA